MPNHLATAMNLLDPATIAATELDAINRDLERMDAPARIAWALAYLPGTHALSTSFGVQSRVG